MNTAGIGKLLKNKLNQSFIAKREINPSYSLRAFARDLKIDPTLLSRLMKGERNLSKKMTQRLLGELNIPLTQALELSLKDSGKIKGAHLTDGMFKPISKWYFFAILDLFLLADFKSDAKWISRKIGLSVSETNAAIQILADSGHINIEKVPWTIDSQNTTWTNFSSTNRERMNYQKQLLDKAKEAIDNIRFEERENGSLTLAASSKLVPEIKKRIQIFKNELRDLIESEKDYDSIYQVVISYFPLTKKDI